ncbi:MAG: cytochrome c [Chitinophagales bacterium]|nr:cytochrome c [Chitinophagales bacterium]
MDKPKLNFLSKFKIAALAPLAIVLLLLWFVYNVYTNGQVQHPGKSTYQTECAGCHGDNGEGTAQLIPPLVRADYAIRHFDSIPCWITNGMNHPIIVNDIEYNQVMYGKPLSDVEAANVINYVAQQFLKNDRKVNSAWVNQQWQKCK